jgi:hypothetical protein
MITVLLLVPAAFLVCTLLLWVFYLAVMHLQEARDAGRIKPESLSLAKVVLYIGLFIDCAYNMTWATLIYLDPPREFLVTQRLKRYKYGYNTYRLMRDEEGRIRLFRVFVMSTVTGWRLQLTEWFALVLLDWADPSGKHV